jgi:hypothetical protein
MQRCRSAYKTKLHYGCESWTIDKISEMTIDSLDRKILRARWGPVKENGTWLENRGK